MTTKHKRLLRSTTENEKFLERAKAQLGSSDGFNLRLSKAAVYCSLMFVSLSIPASFFFYTLMIKMNELEFRLHSLIQENELLRVENANLIKTLLLKDSQPVNSIPLSTVVHMSDEYKMFLFKTGLIILCLVGCGVMSLYCYGWLKSFLVTDGFSYGLKKVNMYCTDLLYNFLGHTSYTFLEYNDPLGNTIRLKVSGLDKGSTGEVFIRLKDSETFMPLTEFFAQNPGLFSNYPTGTLDDSVGGLLSTALDAASNQALDAAITAADPALQAAVDAFLSCN